MIGAAVLALVIGACVALIFYVIAVTVIENVRKEGESDRGPLPPRPPRRSR